MIIAPSLLILFIYDRRGAFETLVFTPNLALYKGPIVINVFYKKKYAYGKYLSFATLGSYVACLGTKVFKFLRRVIFADFWQRKSRDQNWSLLIHRFPCDIKNV